MQGIYLLESEKQKMQDEKLIFSFSMPDSAGVICSPKLGPVLERG
jgi:hypothetical protein